MIWKFLKKLRYEKWLSLKQLDSRLNYWIWNLSNYENWKINPRNKTLIKILYEWYEIDKNDALRKIYDIRKKELKKSLFSNSL